MISATPIPRSLASVVAEDLTPVLIEHYPYQRQVIRTVLIRENSMRSIMTELHHTIQLGRKVYVVCPAIESGTGIRSVRAIHQQMVHQFRKRRLDSYMVR